jgi:hypothetical protein
MSERKMTVAKLKQIKLGQKKTNDRYIKHVIEYISSKFITIKTSVMGRSMRLYFVPHHQKVKSFQLKEEHLHPEQQKQQLTTKLNHLLFISI